MNSTESILREKLFNFSIYLKSKCEDQSDINLIDEKLNNLKFYEIMAFIIFLDESKLDSYINDLYTLYHSLENSTEVRESIKESLKYFYSVKQILNDKNNI